MKKKLISLLLVSAMAAATAGCGSSVPANSVNSRDDLPGKKIGVQLGTTGDSDATEYEKNDGSTVERYNKGADAIQALKTGKIDCVIIDQQPAEAFVEKNDDLKILSDTFDPEEYAICIAKGNSDLTDKFNSAIEELQKDGTIDSITSNYIGDEVGKHPYETPDGTEYPNGTLTMATNAQFDPYEYYDGDQIVGIDADIAKAICDKLGYELKIEDMEFDAIIAAVSSGKADFGAAGMTVTEDRLKNVNFTDSYATGVQVVIVKEGSDITTVDDLFADGANHSIGVQSGTTGDIYCTDDIEGKKLGTVERFNKGADAVQALIAGKIDCVVIDNQPAKEFVAANEGLKILDTEYVTEDYAIAIKKGNDKLTEKINGALKELKDEGKVQEILDKYINAE